MRKMRDLYRRRLVYSGMPTNQFSYIKVMHGSLIMSSSAEQQYNVTQDSWISAHPATTQSDVPFITIPTITGFHYGTVRTLPLTADISNRPLVIRLYGASPPPQPAANLPAPRRPLTRIPAIPPPSNRPEPHLPQSGSPWLPPDAARETTTRRFTCAWINCNKYYSTIERANRHIKTTHMKGRNWVCQQCGHFSAKEEEKLTDHLRRTGHKDDRWPGFEFWKRI